jgi:hypothetical protein
MVARHDFGELFAHYAETIEKMGHEFTSHEFILRLAQANQGLYIDALNAYRDQPAPFRTVHAILAKHLHSERELVVYLGDQDSIDIFGQAERCAKWRKLQQR